MDFDTCFQLLASRPAHAHEHCVDEQHDHHNSSVDIEEAITDAVAASSVSASEPSHNNEPQVQNVSAIGREFFALQERRVQIYKDFQNDFNKLKATPDFQPFCASITAQFANVSKQVNTLEAALRRHEQQQKRIPLAQLLRKVQIHEKEKLLLTSALLVEKMRLSDMENRAEPNESILALLEKSITTMEAKHTEIIVQINELLEELRMELADDDEQEEDE